MGNYFVYIIRCSDKYLYVGITANVQRRLVEHVNGLCRNTKNRGKISLVYTEKFETRFEAAKREKEIKGWRREKKENLINTQSDIRLL
jgi:putative endonuclease